MTWHQSCDLTFLVMVDLKHFLQQGKAHLLKIKTQLPQSIQRSIQRSIQNFDPQVLADWLTRARQKQDAAFYGTLATVVLSTYFLSNVTALILGEALPVTPPSRDLQIPRGAPRGKTLEDYSLIYSRNLFNSQGLIPGEADPSAQGPDLGAVPVKSTLPFNLIGTLILENEFRSIATIEDKSTVLIHPVQVDDEIPDKVKILKIEAMRVTFLNKNTGRREFIELPEDTQGMIKQTSPIHVSKPLGGGVEKVSPTQFSVSKSAVDRSLADFNNVLTQARAVPNTENGVPAGFKLFQIVPGSIYEQLGLKNGDVITGLNGQPMNDLGKAVEMLEELKKSPHLELQVKKDGKPLTYTYDIH